MIAAVLLVASLLLLSISLTSKGRYETKSMLALASAACAFTAAVVAAFIK